MKRWFGGATLKKDLKALVREKGIEYFLCSFVEMSGVPKAKLVPAAALDDMVSDGAGFAGFAAGNVGQGPADPDLVCVPDMEAMIQLPWRKNIAWVPGMLQVEELPSKFCPRRILAHQLDIGRKRGYELMVGAEPEFMLLKRGPDGACVPWDAMDNAEKPCYDMRSLNRNLDLLTRLVGHMQELGWEPYAADHEDANCQFEINWKYADALTTCDRQIFFKWMVKILAEEQGLHATFMPKPFANLTGNGSHCHLSLADAKTKKNLFYSKEDPLGLSAEARWFMGGILKHAPALSAILAPTVNSYKRLVRGRPRSGSTWAPVYITYGSANRTQMIRVPGPGRIENRMIDGAANPYLACAAMLAAGLDGIDNKIDPGAPSHDNLYAVGWEELRARGIGHLPSTLQASVEALAQDEVVRNSLGAEYADYYIQVKTEEWESYHNSVSQWELDRYLNIH
jgi:glutamine synthetase